MYILSMDYELIMENLLKLVVFWIEKWFGLFEKCSEIMLKNISKQTSNNFTILSILCSLDLTKYVHQIAKDQQYDHPGLASIFYFTT